MPYRKLPLASGEIYHVYNRSIAKQSIFNNLRDYKRIEEVINFYRFKKLPLRYSYYKRLPKEQKNLFRQEHLIKNEPMINIIAYCIMPNHFHFLLQPLQTNAISDFMRNIQNSYSKYYNTKYERTGSLFQNMFKAVRIETDEQLIHVSRYIHLNPITAYLMEIEKIQYYPWSSYKNYLSTNKSSSMVYSKTLLSHFKSAVDYEKFVNNQADYQRKLDRIKHITLD